MDAFIDTYTYIQGNLSEVTRDRALKVFDLIMADVLKTGKEFAKITIADIAEGAGLSESTAFKYVKILAAKEVIQIRKENARNYRNVYYPLI